MVFRGRLCVDHSRAVLALKHGELAPFVLRLLEEKGHEYDKGDLDFMTHHLTAALNDYHALYDRTIFLGPLGNPRPCHPEVLP